MMNRYEWHPWFAWYPVRVTFIPVDPESYWRKTVWLRWVECRIVGDVAPTGDLTDQWQYRVKIV